MHEARTRPSNPTQRPEAVTRAEQTTRDGRWFPVRNLQQTQIVLPAINSALSQIRVAMEANASDTSSPVSLADSLEESRVRARRALGGTRIGFIAGKGGGSERHRKDLMAGITKAYQTGRAGERLPEEVERYAEDALSTSTMAIAAAEADAKLGEPSPNLNAALLALHLQGGLNVVDNGTSIRVHLPIENGGKSELLCHGGGLVPALMHGWNENCTSIKPTEFKSPAKDDGATQKRMAEALEFIEAHKAATLARAKTTTIPQPDLEQTLIEDDLRADTFLAMEKYQVMDPLSDHFHTRSMHGTSSVPSADK